MLEMPLSAASFVFYRTTRFIMRRLIVLNSTVNRKRTRQWNMLSAEALDLPLAMPALMTSGPRWNPHAVIAGAGPFYVAQSVSVDVASPAASSKSWTLVFYTFPAQRTAAHVGSLDGPFAAGWHAVKLAPGKYSVALRYYHAADTVTFPELQADGVTAIPSFTTANRSRELYESVARRRGRLYFWLHYYVYELLRRKASVSPKFVEREFLPIGNPETQFRYGAVDRGDLIDVRLPAGLRDTHDVYLTIYTRDSFPVSWCQIQEDHVRAEPAAAAGFYLMRVQRTSPDADPAAAKFIEIQTGGGNKEASA